MEALKAGFARGTVAAWLSCSAALMVLPAAAAAEPAAVAQLVEQARFWEQSNRPDLAMDSWRRVLEAQAGNPEALGRLVVLESQAGNEAAAQRYLQELRRVAPDSKSLQEAQSQRRVPGVASALDRARAAGAQGKSDEAVKAYRESFGGEVPPNDALALEYYETLAGTQDGWSAASEGLRTLSRKNPADTRTSLAYGRVLTYRAASRRDGIERLSGLAGDARHGADARRAWRQGLVWLQAQPGDAGLYRNYLAVAGSDAELEAKLTQLQQRRVAPATPKTTTAAAVPDARLREGFAALESDDLAGAEAAFERVLAATPGDADASAGLGLVRLRQSRFVDARRLFDTAVQRKPALESRYRDARRTAVLWSQVRAAEAADAAGDLKRAGSDYEAALAQVPRGSIEPSVERAYANLLVRSGRRDAAERRLHEVLKAHPGQPELLAELANILVASDRAPEAEKLLAQLPAGQGAALRSVRAELARTQARTALAAGRPRDAERLLLDALVTAPDSPWVRLDLARVYRQSGRAAEADSLLDAMVDAAADSSDGWLAQAYAYAESQRWYETLQALENVAPAQRTAAAQNLQREAWVRYQIQRAIHAAQRGEPSRAAEWIGAAVTAAGKRPELASALAQGWAALGDPARAVAELRRSFAAQAEPAAGDRIQYAALLLQIDQDAEFEAVSTALIQRGNMTQPQQATLEDLVVGYRLKLADRARENGQLAESYRQLREVVARYPRQARVKMALARLFVSAGEPDKALALTRGLMAEAEPDDTTLFAAIDAALAAGDDEQAARWIDQAFDRGRDLPAAHRAAARLAERRKRDAVALGHYRAAERLEQRVAVGPPQLVLIDPGSGNAESLPQPLRDLLSEDDVPVGPLLPRALGPDPAAPIPALEPENFAGLRLERSVGNRSGAVPAATARSPLALKMDRRVASTDISSAVLGPQPTPVERLEGSVSGWALGGLMSRNRQGESGLSRLFDMEFPIDWVSPQWRAGRLGVRAKPVYINAGSVSGRTNKLKFGSLALLNGASGDLQQSDSGIALDVAYGIGDLVLDIGTTPVGFALEDFVAGLNWSPKFGDVTLGLDVSRRSVTDSLLSYAGAYDPLTGRYWGGVMRTGGRADLAYDFNSYGLYINAGYYTLDGRNVDDNTQFEFGGGLFVHAFRTENQKLTVGLNLTTFGYRDNLRHFTLGHGGYFSPQFFTAVTVPLSYSGRSGRLSYLAEAAIGLQTFREDGAPLFPGRASLQNELEQLAAFEPAANLPLGYSSQSNSGLGYRLGGAAQYLLTNGLVVGGSLSVDNATDYQEFQFVTYLRWYFSGVQSVPEAPRLPRIFESPLR